MLSIGTDGAIVSADLLPSDFRPDVHRVGAYPTEQLGDVRALRLSDFEAVDGVATLFTLMPDIATGMVN